MTVDASISMSRGTFRLNARLSDSGVIFMEGENGSGKTTFLRAVAGHFSEFTGRVIVNGRDVTNVELQRRGIIYLNSETVLLNLDVDSHISWPRNPERYRSDIKALKDNLRVDFRGRVSELSLGQKMRLAAASAIFHRPDLIIMDEVTSGISDSSSFIKSLSALAGEKGIDIIFVSHNPSDGELADHVYRMVNGSLSRIS
ncbi:MAG: ATP-binding cassette domain-containing protein [Candidatus Thermoplasmatota archaeon]|jgi:ABC-type multidrug transport system ATPase subunit|nr:ATP-binding cassette domain-containing protein [Candidatus Thermoplasmatota archaeon]